MHCNAKSARRPLKQSSHTGQVTGDGKQLPVLTLPPQASNASSDHTDLYVKANNALHSSAASAV
jgi:hypothetical protein